jgi:hypothetical protein
MMGRLEAAEATSHDDDNRLAPFDMGKDVGSAAIRHVQSPQYRPIYAVYRGEYPHLKG